MPPRHAIRTLVLILNYSFFRLLKARYSQLRQLKGQTLITSRTDHAGGASSPMLPRRVKCCRLPVWQRASQLRQSCAAQRVFQRLPCTFRHSTVHLSAAMGKDVITLLPIFEDERWTNHLSRQTSYKKHCQILKQKEYGKWDNEINTLFKRLIASAT